MPSVEEAARALAREEAERAERAAQRMAARRKRFRSSLAWRRARYAVLAENAARNGGAARCELCGARAAPGAPLHVDHIEPISKSWERRLDRANLQVLCSDCNVGKLAGPARDFRPAAL